VDHTFISEESLDLLTVARTFRIGTIYEKFVHVLEHSQKKDPCFWVFSVRHKTVHHKGMYEAEERLLNITKRIEMPTNSDGVFGGEDGVGRIRFHHTAKTIAND
jgi:hypothetical protein